MTPEARIVVSYGQLPELEERVMREFCRMRLPIAKLDASSSPIEPIKIIQLIQTDRNFKLAGQDKLTWAKATANLKERVTAVKELFKKLSG